MASYSVDVNTSRGVRAKVTTANVVDTITFNSPVSVVEILNMDGADAVYVTTDGSNPSVAGDNTQVMPAAVGSMRLPMTNGGTVLKLVSASPVTYSASWSSQ